MYSVECIFHIYQYVLRFIAKYKVNSELLILCEESPTSSSEIIYLLAPIWGPYGGLKSDWTLSG